MREMLWIVVAALFVPGSQAPDVEVPAAAAAFVAPGTTPLAFETADLDRDGRPDAILVLDPIVKDGEDRFAERPRPLLVLVGQADGSYREAARNAKVVYCAACGGVMGDPFQGVSAGPGTFTVHNAGGSAWRWGVDYTFGYSRRDTAWQLVKVVETSFHASDPKGPTETVSRPPKAFGKIDLAAFDPENWKNQGPR
jgi:hypothetical protein